MLSFTILTHVFYLDKWRPFLDEGLLATIHYHESDWQTDPDVSSF